MPDLSFVLLGGYGKVLTQSFTIQLKAITAIEVIKVHAESDLTLAHTQQGYDGGYYAIKGFLYQFDQTLIRLFNNPNSTIRFENIQDIDYEDYVIQIKHKETQKYQPSKIRKPIIQLINIFSEDNSKKLRLYCHFKDTLPRKKELTLEELDVILGKEKHAFLVELKNAFISNFIIEYANDYNQQFKRLLHLIKEFYGLKDEDFALYYHSIFRSEIFRLAVKERKLRSINKLFLDNLIQKYQSLVFYYTYSTYLSKESYEKFIHKTVFKQRTINTPNFERIFIIDCTNFEDSTELQQIIHRISVKFYKKEKSPAPFICFRNLKQDITNQIKQEMVDRDFPFADGTLFNGDKFRVKKITNPSTDVKVRFLDEHKLQELIGEITVHETYQFFIKDSIEISTERKHIKIQLDNTSQIINII